MYIPIDTVFCQLKFSFKEKIGVLLSSPVGCDDSKNISESLYGKAVVLYEYINSPYNIRYIKTDSGKINVFIRFYAKLLVFFCEKCYPIAYLLTFLRFTFFENACEAAEAFRKIINSENQKILCLPRSIFIATTSKKFKQSGAMFIGVFLPSNNMHAWVIEDNVIADRYDIDWILYTPVSMMV